MPTYDYACDSCGHAFERTHGVNEEISKKCPACSRRKVRRMISSKGNFVLKGNGWYKDGYGGKQ
jgi:putative FmdB family regulatory protein